MRAGAAGLENPTLCELHSRDLLSISWTWCSSANSPEGLPPPHLRGACLTFHRPPGSTGKGQSWVPSENQKSYVSVRRDLESLGLWSCGGKLLEAKAINPADLDYWITDYSLREPFQWVPEPGLG